MITFFLNMKVKSSMMMIICIQELIIRNRKNSVIRFLVAKKLKNLKIKKIKFWDFSYAFFALRL